MSKQADFEEFEASELYCPSCKVSGPVRRRLLLVLPTGNKFEYLCAECNTTVGSKTDNDTEEFLIVPP